jgi:hypothetical protein
MIKSKFFQTRNLKINFGLIITIILMIILQNNKVLNIYRITFSLKWNLKFKA